NLAEHPAVQTARVSLVLARRSSLGSVRPRTPVGIRGCTKTVGGHRGSLPALTALTQSAFAQRCGLSLYKSSGGEDSEFADRAMSLLETTGACLSMRSC